MTWPTPPGADEPGSNPQPSPWRPVEEPKPSDETASTPEQGAPAPEAQGPTPETGSAPEKETTAPSAAGTGSAGPKVGTALKERLGRARERSSAMVTAAREGNGRGGKGPLLVGAAVVGVLVLGGAVFALTRGGGSSDGTVPVLADVGKEPEQDWTYDYGVGQAATLHGYSVDDRLLTLLLGPSDPYEQESPWELTSVDLKSGEERWSIEVEPAPDSYAVTLDGVVDGHAILRSGLGPGLPVGETIQAYEIDGGDQVWEFLPGEDEQLMVAEPQDALLLVSGYDVSRVPVEAPGEDPLWTMSSMDVVYGVGADEMTDPGYIALAGEGETVLVETETGEIPEWYEDGDRDRYHLVGGDVYRVTHFDRGSVLARLDDDGTADWEHDATSFTVTRSAGGDPLLFASYSSNSGADYLMRLDPRDGSEAWDEEVLTDLSGMRTPTGSTIPLVGDGMTELLSLDDGELVGRINGAPSSLVGSKTYYVADDGRLEAYDDEGERKWRVRMGAEQSLIGADGRLVTHDGDRGRFIGWG